MARKTQVYPSFLKRTYFLQEYNNASHGAHSSLDAYAPVLAGLYDTYRNLSAHKTFTNLPRDEKFGVFIVRPVIIHTVVFPPS